MAVIEASDIWVLKDYAQLFDTSNVNEPKPSPPLDALTHYSFPGLTWRVQLYPRGGSCAKPGFSSVYVWAHFGSEKLTSVWAQWTLTVVPGDAKASLQATTSRSEYLSGGPAPEDHWGIADAFLQEELNAAIRKDGHLEMKLDLTIFKVVDLLNCRETVRALLTDNRHMDIVVSVDGTTFSWHKAILALTSPGLNNGSVPDGIIAAAFSAFLGCLYCDSYQFLSNWELVRGVLRLSDYFGLSLLKKLCDRVLGELIPTLELPILLEILTESIKHDAPMTKAACIQCLAERKDIRTSADWINFKEASEDVRLFKAICDGFLEKVDVGTASIPKDCLDPEVTLSHSWSISNADLLKASAPVVPRSTSVRSPPFLQHKSFAGLEWQLEFHPQGNAEDPNYQPGFTSLYLKANFDPANNVMKAVFAEWKASISVKHGALVFVPESSGFILYTGTREMTFGYANAFTFEQCNESRDASNLNLDIRLELTILNVEDLLCCQYVFTSLHSHLDKTHADVEIDVNGSVFKAHKFILAARSTVFARMFQTDMAENMTGKVEVKETTPEAFEAFLAGVYYASWTFLSDMDDTIDVLNLAERYAVVDLKRYCDEALVHFANASTLLTILPYAVAHNAEASKAACVEMLFSNPDLLKSDGWIKFKREAKKEIMADIAEAVGELYRKERKHREGN